MAQNDSKGVGDYEVIAQVASDTGTTSVTLRTRACQDTAFHDVVLTKRIDPYGTCHMALNMNDCARFDKRYCFLMPKYDDYPEQAEADLQRANAEVGRLDSAHIEAEARLEELERDIDAAYEAGDEAGTSRLHAEYQRVEQEVQDLSTDLEGAWESLRNTTEFWGLN